MRAAVLASILFASVALAAPTGSGSGSGVQTNTGALDHKLATVDTPKHFHQDCDVHNTQCKATNDAVYGEANTGEGMVGKQAGNIATAGANMLKTEGQSDLASHVATDGGILQHDLQGRTTSTPQSQGLPIVGSGSLNKAPVLSTVSNGVQPSKLAQTVGSTLPAGQVGQTEAEGKQAAKPLLSTAGNAEKTVLSDLAVRAAPNGNVNGNGNGNHGHSQTNQGAKQTSDEAFPSLLVSHVGDAVEKQGSAVQAAGNGVNDVTHEANSEAQTLASFNKDHGGELVNAIVS